jgi:hypothetical protein
MPFPDNTDDNQPLLQSPLNTNPDENKKKETNESAFLIWLRTFFNIANPLTLTLALSGMFLTTLTTQITQSAAQIIKAIQTIGAALTGPAIFLALGAMEFWNTCTGWYNFFKLLIKEHKFSGAALGGALSATCSTAGCALLAAVGLNTAFGGTLIASTAATFLGTIAPAMFVASFAINATISFYNAFDTYYTLKNRKYQDSKKNEITENFFTHNWTHKHTPLKITARDRFNIYGKNILLGCTATAGLLAVTGALLVPAVAGIALAAAFPPLFIALITIGIIVGAIFLGMSLYSKFHKKSLIEKAAEKAYQNPNMSLNKINDEINKELENPAPKTAATPVATSATTNTTNVQNPIPTIMPPTTTIGQTTPQPEKSTPTSATTIFTQSNIFSPVSPPTTVIPPPKTINDNDTNKDDSSTQNHYLRTLDTWPSLFKLPTTNANNTSPITYYNNDVSQSAAFFTSNTMSSQTPTTNNANAQAQAPLI